MASRRTRIKGIANIPQRKKLNSENVQSVDSFGSDSISVNNEHENENSKEDKNSSQIHSQEKNKESIIFHSNMKICETKNILEITEGSNKKITGVCENNQKSEETVSTCTLSQPDIFNQNSDFVEVPKPKSNLPRRKFLKPGINLNAVKKRSISNVYEETTLKKENIDSEKDDQHLQSSIPAHVDNSIRASETIKIVSEIKIPKAEGILMNCTSQPVLGSNNLCSDKKKSEMTLNETHLGVNESPALNNSVTSMSSPNIKKVIPDSNILSDSEYPAPPPSPSKVNRARIKAIPRLSQRKTSCSASESEDETRKHGRIRNNSVCSIVSSSGLDHTYSITEPLNPKETVSVAQKKNVRNEQSRKLAEARREFQKRFGANSPDKQSLKMIDLIFYNPTSNPMSEKPGKKQSQTEPGEAIDDPEEKQNDPAEKQDDKTENIKETENCMPVPQIKIGPSGEIILDEQSLVFENSDIAKQKEKILNSRIVDGDYETGYGIYKRASRSLSWSPKETLRFYKALNLIGTDFSLMTQFFPKRSRRELKVKFKKEEKINRHLVDKAIMQPRGYNFLDLKREVELEQAEEVALKNFEEELKKKEKINKQNVDKKRKAKEIKENREETKDDFGNLHKKRLKSSQKTKSKLKKFKSKKLDINSVLEDESDADISDMETQSESEEEETIPFLKPTRSGRIPKSTKRIINFEQITHQPLINSVKQAVVFDSAILIPNRKSMNCESKLIFSNESPGKDIQDDMKKRRSLSLDSNTENLVPGSVVIMTEEDSNGKTEYKVFMVTPDKKMESLDLESDVIENLMSERDDDQEDSIEVVVPPIQEENFTIPASDDKDNVEPTTQNL